MGRCIKILYLPIFIFIFACSTKTPTVAPSSSGNGGGTGSSSTSSAGGSSGGMDQIAEIEKLLSGGGILGGGGNGSSTVDNPLAAILGGGGGGGVGGAGASSNVMSYYADAQGSPLPFATYVSPYVNHYKQDYSFVCPGDSFITGEYSTTDADPQLQVVDPTFDRRFIYTCSFFADGSGKAARRTKCSVLPTHSVSVDVQQASSCPSGTFIAGVDSTYDASKKTRNVSHHCCQMVTVENTPVVIANQPMGTNSSASVPVCSSGVNLALAESGQADNSQVTSYLHQCQYIGCLNQDVNKAGAQVQFDAGLDFYFDPNACLDSMGVQTFGGTSACQNFFAFQNGIMVSETTRFTGSQNLYDRIFSFKSCALQASSSASSSSSSSSSTPSSGL